MYMNLFRCKVNVKYFGFDNLHQDFNIMKIVVHTAIDACRYNRRKENIYNERLITIHLAFFETINYVFGMCNDV